jgi:hypothetical protein
MIVKRDHHFEKILLNQRQYEKAELIGDKLIAGSRLNPICNFLSRGASFDRKKFKRHLAEKVYYPGPMVEALHLLDTSPGAHLGHFWQKKHQEFSSRTTA